MENDNNTLNARKTLAHTVLHITPAGLESIKELARQEAAKELKKYSNHLCDCDICRKYY